MQRIVPKKNYIILFLLVLLVISACVAFVNLYEIHQTNKISTSPLAKQEVLYKDLKNALNDLDADTFLVISYINDRNVYNNEKNIKKVLEQNNLIDNVLYLNITEYIEDNNFINELNKTLELDNKINKFPAVIFYQDGKPIYVIDSSKQLINKNDFEQIIDMYLKAS